MSSILVNFYEEVANIPFSTKTLNELNNFVSQKFNLSLPDVQEFQYFYIGEDSQKITIKNNLDLNRAIYFLKHSKGRKEILINIKEESRLFKEKFLGQEVSQAEKIKLEILEKENMLREILEKERIERERKESEAIEIQKLKEVEEFEKILQEKLRSKEEELRLAEEQKLMMEKIEAEKKMLAERIKNKELQKLDKVTKLKKEALGKLKNEAKAKKNPELNLGTEFTDLSNNINKLVNDEVKKFTTNFDSHIIGEISHVCSKYQKKKEILHLGVSCDGCSMRPIKGIRYQCTVCNDFDYCEACEEKFSTSHQHPFLKIRNPCNAPIQIKVELKESKEEVKKSPEVISVDKPVEMNQPINQPKTNIFQGVKGFINKFMNINVNPYSNKVAEMKAMFSLEGISDEKIYSALEKTQGDIDSALCILFA